MLVTGKVKSFLASLVSSESSWGEMEMAEAALGQGHEIFEGKA